MNGKEKLMPLFEIANNVEEDQKIIVNPDAGKMSEDIEGQTQTLTPLCRRVTQEERDCATAGWKIPGDLESIQKSTQSPVAIPTPKEETAKVSMPKSSSKSRVVRESRTVESERLMKAATKPQEVVEPQDERTIYVSAKPHSGIMADNRNSSGWEMAYYLKEENTILKKKNRRKMRSYEIVESEKLGLGLLKLFDDGTTETEYLSNNFGGSSYVYRIEFSNESGVKTLWAIQSNRGRVIGVLEQLNEKKLFDAFLKSGVRFFSDISEKIIRRALFQRFYSEIINTCHVCKMEYLPGWELQNDNSTMVFNQGIKSRFQGEFLDFKDLEFKKIDVFKENVEVLKIYSYVLDHVEDDGLRLAIQYIPYLAMLNTLFEKENLFFGRMLNFIMVDNFSQISILEYFLQIFDRDEKFVNLDTTCSNRSKINRKIGHAKDEILAIRLVDSGQVSYYQKGKEDQNLKWIKDLVNGHAILEDPFNRRVKCQFCLFSNKRVTDTASVYVSNDNLEELKYIWEHQVGDVVGVVNSMFLQYVSKYQEKLKPIIQKARTSDCLEVGILESVNEILQHFYAYYEIDSRRLEVDRQFFGEFIASESTDVTEIFMFKLMDSVKNYYFLDKNTNEFVEGAIYIDDDNLWLTEEIFTEILSCNWIAEFKSSILVNLKFDNFLVTDQVGFKRRVTIAGERREVYQFDRRIIDAGYGVDITIFGKEINSND